MRDLFCYSLVFWLRIATLVDTTTEDSITLLSLRNAVGDSTGTLAGWNSSTNTCLWNGVRCSHSGQVTGLSLRFLELSSSLLAETIANLTRLRHLDVSGSNFTDTMAGMTPQDCSLRVLDVSENRLNGSIPSELFAKCKELRRLKLSRNQISGTLSSSHFGNGSCKRLKVLDLSSNRLAGSVPPEIFSSFVSLQEISLSYNRFSGDFPSLESPNNIAKIDLAENSFSGFLIISGVVCTNLTELDISSNNISGRVFLDGVQCSSLKLLNLSLNSFSGPVDQALGSSSIDKIFLPALEVLDASYNGFTGETPRFHENLKFLNLSSNSFNTTDTTFCHEHPPSKLASLLLPNNKLVGHVLDSVMSCGNLEMLDLSFNNVSGEIPYDLCERLPRLQHLLIWVNKLEGPIPPTFGNCSNLITAIASYNNLQGEIPPEISRLRDLWWLSFTGNNLTGTIPSSLGSLKNINVLQLGNNSLGGGIPPELSECENLLILDLSSNRLTGGVPARVGRDHRGKFFANATPVVSSPLGNCGVLEAHESQCKGRDEIFSRQGISVEDLGRVLSKVATECQWSMQSLPMFELEMASLSTLALSHNNLSGEIPAEISSMETLYKLDLAHNSLSGPIPTSLGELKAVQILDLSENSLSGRIPESIAQLTFLVHLNVSYNNLSGLIPQKGQLTTFDSSSFEGNPDLFGFPLTNVSAARSSSGAPLWNEDHEESDDGFGGYGEELVTGIPCFLFSFLAVSTGIVLWSRGCFLCKLRISKSSL